MHLATNEQIAYLLSKNDGFRPLQGIMHLATKDDYHDATFESFRPLQGIMHLATAC